MKPDFCISILGKSSALPTKSSFPSSQLVRYHNQAFLVDCGEGCQIQLRRNQVALSTIQHIFISHMHGDHFYGLFGLLSSMNLLGRKRILHIYSHPKLQSVIRFVFATTGEMPRFPIVFHDVNYNTKTRIYSSKKLDVYAFPLDHRIPVSGFLFQEKPGELKIRKEAIEKYKMTYQEIRRVKSGGNLVRDGKPLASVEALTYKPEPMRSYAYCSDTRYFPDMTHDIKGVQCLYHEATFSDDMTDYAKKTFHSTGRQAAETARSAGVSKLLLGHFSTRYKDASEIEAQAREVFPESYAVNENDLYCL
jgi:ribonuclease Z